MSTDDLRDTAEAIDPTAEDPNPVEITDREHGDWAEPYTDATPIGGDLR